MKRRKMEAKNGFTLAAGRAVQIDCNCSLSSERGWGRGFTLAEVLITLVIIGVIAALTVPSLIQRTQKQELVTALKKAYSTLSQATNEIIAEEGIPLGEGGWGNGTEGWGIASEKIYSLYKPHLNIMKDCGGNTGCLPQCRGLKTCFKFLHGRTSYDPNMENSSGVKKIILQDGMQVMFEAFGREIYVDINGVKNPNQFGRDVFTFVLSENGLKPYGCSNISNCQTRSGGGADCTCKVLSEGAMNY